MDISEFFVYVLCGIATVASFITLFNQRRLDKAFWKGLAVYKENTARQDATEESYSEDGDYGVVVKNVDTGKVEFFDQFDTESDVVASLVQHTDMTVGQASGLVLTAKANEIALWNGYTGVKTPYKRVTLLYRRKD